MLLNGGLGRAVSQHPYPEDWWARLGARDQHVGARSTGETFLKATHLCRFLCWGEKSCRCQEVKLLGALAVKAAPSDKLGRIGKPAWVSMHCSQASCEKRAKIHSAGSWVDKDTYSKGFGVREYLVYWEEGNLPVLNELLSTDKPWYKPMELQVTDAAVNTDRHQEWCRSMWLLAPWWCVWESQLQERRDLWYSELEGSGQITSDLLCEPKAADLPKYEQLAQIDGGNSKALSRCLLLGSLTNPAMRWQKVGEAAGRCTKQKHRPLL